jgi:heme/copper-type cytochrome/quinol oxidase subunit 4
MIIPAMSIFAIVSNAVTHGQMFSSQNVLTCVFCLHFIIFIMKFERFQDIHLSQSESNEIDIHKLMQTNCIQVLL